MLQRKENLKKNSCVSQYTHIHAVNLPLDAMPIKKIALITILPYKTWGFIQDFKTKENPCKVKTIVSHR